MNDDKVTKDETNEEGPNGRVSDRTLERLRLGELPDEEAAEVMARLEAAGESHRLDALIAADEEFLERYPAAAAASQIKELRRRRERQKEPGRKGRIRRGPVIVTAVAVAALVVVATTLMVSQPSQDPRANADPEGERGDPTLADPKPAEDDRLGAAAMDEGEAWAGMLPWLIERSRTHGPGVMGCESGETITFDATGIRRVTTDRSDVLKVATADHDGKKLKVTCTGLGTATLSVFRSKGEPPRNVMIRVAPRYVEEPQAVLAPGARLYSKLRPCGDLDDMEVHVLLDRNARPEMVMVAGGTAADRACVRREALDFRGRSGTIPEVGYALVKAKLGMPW